MVDYEKLLAEKIDLEPLARFFAKEPPQEYEEGEAITIRQEGFDTSKIIEYKGATLDKMIFRPETLEQYIGQDHAKETIKTAIRIINELRPVHFLINGRAGLGKSTIVYILCNMIKARLIYRVANEITSPLQIVDIINNITSYDGLSVLFIDEIHSLSTNLAECFYPILEDFKIANKNIKPFIFAGATTNKDKLIKNMLPLVDRTQIQITLEKYNNDNIEDIIVQYNEQLYPRLLLDPKDYEIIAINSKGTPRLAISLLMKQLVIKDIYKVLKESNIIYKGLTNIDIKILNALNETNKPMGSSALAQRCGIYKLDYEEIYEPYLCEEGYISRTNRGRIISNLGLETLTKIGG